MKALEKDPSERFQQATDMAIALEQAMAAQMPIPGPSPRVTAGRTPTPTNSCARCGAPNAPQQRFCTNCGTPLGPGAAAVSQQRPARSTGAQEAWVTCPHCQRPNRALDRFCTNCGHSLLVGVVGRNCSRCGTRNAAGVRFCTKCGNALG
jgi:membrane protease subunit (stomatin/prohibitin family)